MASAVSALSQTLENITLTKIKELEKQRTKYETRKNEALKVAGQSDDQRTRITRLLQGVKDLYPGAPDDNAVRNIRHWLDQSKYDVSVPTDLLQAHEELLRSKLEVQSRKLDLGHLYARLVTEWMTTSSNETADSEEDAFEVVDRQRERLKELCDKFEKVVFEPLEVDEVEIDLHLVQLFQSDEGEEGAKPLKELRRTVGNFCDRLFGRKSPFDENTLHWCINGLLAEDLLSNEKQDILREFLDNSTVLREMADVLNMRFSNIESWDWEAGESGIPVLPRQQLNGKYRIWMDEDVLQAILIHYIGIECCVDLRRSLLQFITADETIWNWHIGPQPDSKDKERRRYYVGRQAFPSQNIDAERKSQYIDQFFLSQLPKTVSSIRSYAADDPSDVQDETKPTNIKQRMLQTLASEVILHKSLNGEAALIQTDLEWFATGLSHSAIFAAMRFLGYSEPVIAFFKKVLQAPLNVQSSPDSPSNQGPKTRRRGVPMAHAPEKLIGELILFMMDLVVNQEDGMLLYRLHDDIWLCGEPEHCAKAWKAMTGFANVMGLKFNKNKTGSAYLVKSERQRNPKVAGVLPKGQVGIGHLLLNPETEKWEIDQAQVKNHVRQLKKQLNDCRSVLQWVQTWNSCIGRFFSHTFGEPAFCFGGDHVDSILATYQWMQRVLFNADEDAVASSVGVVDHIKGMIQDRFGATEIPDAFIYLPEQLGGLGLRNPFISFLVIRQDLQGKSPEAIIKGLHEDEREVYKERQKRFDELGNVESRVARNAATGHFAKDKDSIKNRLTAEERENFFSFEEFTRWRAITSIALANAYDDLRKTPKADGPALDGDVTRVLWQDLNIQPSDQSGKAREVRWALQMYGDLLRRNYGGMRLIDEKYLPLGVLTVMRKKRVRWNMVL